jgi:hypothetical protein
MGPFRAQRDAPSLAVCACSQECGGLPLHNLLLQRRQEGFRLCQAQPDLLKLLAGLLQDDDICNCLFMTIIVTHHQLHFDLHEGHSSGWMNKQGIDVL